MDKNKELLNALEKSGVLKDSVPDGDLITAYEMREALQTEGLYRIPSTPSNLSS